MSMSNNGLSKLTEELGELAQVVGKKLARPDTDEHWDGAGSLKLRMEEEMADVTAAMAFVRHKLGLDMAAIRSRAELKYAMFLQWDADENA